MDVVFGFYNRYNAALNAMEIKAGDVGRLRKKCLNAIETLLAGDEPLHGLFTERDFAELKSNFRKIDMALMEGQLNADEKEVLQLRIATKIEKLKNAKLSISKPLPINPTFLSGLESRLRALAAGQSNLKERMEAIRFSIDQELARELLAAAKEKLQAIRKGVEGEAPLSEERLQALLSACRALRAPHPVSIAKEEDPLERVRAINQENVQSLLRALFGQKFEHAREKFPHVAHYLSRLAANGYSPELVREILENSHLFNKNQLLLLVEIDRTRPNVSDRNILNFLQGSESHPVLSNLMLEHVSRAYSQLKKEDDALILILIRVLLIPQDPDLIQVAYRLIAREPLDAMQLVRHLPPNVQEGLKRPFQLIEALCREESIPACRTTLRSFANLEAREMGIVLQAVASLNLVKALILAGSNREFIAAIMAQNAGQAHLEAIYQLPDEVKGAAFSILAVELFVRGNFQLAMTSLSLAPQELRAKSSLAAVRCLIGHHTLNARNLLVSFLKANLLQEEELPMTIFSEMADADPQSALLVASLLKNPERQMKALVRVAASLFEQHNDFRPVLALLQQIAESRRVEFLLELFDFIANLEDDGEIPVVLALALEGCEGIFERTCQSLAGKMIVEGELFVSLREALDNEKVRTLLQKAARHELDLASTCHLLHLLETDTSQPTLQIRLPDGTLKPLELQFALRLAHRCASSAMRHSLTLKALLQKAPAELTPERIAEVLPRACDFTKVVLALLCRGKEAGRALLGTLNANLQAAVASAGALTESREEISTFQTSLEMCYTAFCFRLFVHNDDSNDSDSALSYDSDDSTS